MAEDTLPELRVDLPALEHNIAVMAQWCAQRGVELCPHIKTTMTRPIVQRQLAAGAWGVTVATVRQAGVALDWGLRRILIANQVVHPGDLETIAQWLNAIGDLELYCLVDSVAGVRAAGSAMVGVQNPLRVLVDVGTANGRTGIRELALGLPIAELCAATPGLLLAGAAGYEGIRPNRRDTETIELVRAHCRATVAVFEQIRAQTQTERPIFSMGGSAFPDLVVDVLAGLSDRDQALVVLRSGCYVTHDHGTYANVSPVAGLRPALSVRTVVLSAPEPGTVVVGAGKRELPYDAGVPVLLGARGVATRLFDHHLVFTEAAGLEVGDVVDLGISHPCSAFDRWAEIAVVDAAGRTSERWRPQFR
ncbi:alanine racemase [Mycolicibacterium brumae]|uniref:D-serine dehydratase-like domain-containing protein n=1 Tax=Mycolicibacterium brumae TaxID=85968 RepID=A0A2G5PG30_9MYCO|nr:alanine racemase [Mycolicibacterium brumae]MCV7194327.1 alanine racemase [Mycolicibacterium brumae]PIB77271.1 hypothetical protein CQY22_003265 [Mycolicibacterium brumae]RWA15525.1 hypothetical protein MBRU_10770 [Mycolicibacterium brumae DSM 44177]UWW10636.1 alanine racemase [Mycolicibacterium brumae]